MELEMNYFEHGQNWGDLVEWEVESSAGETIVLPSDYYDDGTEHQSSKRTKDISTTLPGLSANKYLTSHIECAFLILMVHQFGPRDNPLTWIPIELLEHIIHLSSNPVPNFGNLKPVKKFLDVRYLLDLVLINKGPLLLTTTSKYLGRVRVCISEMEEDTVLAEFPCPGVFIKAYANSKGNVIDILSQHNSTKKLHMDSFRITEDSPVELVQSKTISLELLCSSRFNVSKEQVLRKGNDLLVGMDHLVCRYNLLSEREECIYNLETLPDDTKDNKKGKEEEEKRRKMDRDEPRRDEHYRRGERTAGQRHGHEDNSLLYLKSCTLRGRRVLLCLMEDLTLRIHHFETGTLLASVPLELPKHMRLSARAERFVAFSAGTLVVGTNFIKNIYKGRRFVTRHNLGYLVCWPLHLVTSFAGIDCTSCDGSESNCPSAFSPDNTSPFLVPLPPKRVVKSLVAIGASGEFLVGSLLFHERADKPEQLSIYYKSLKEGLRCKKVLDSFVSSTGGLRSITIWKNAVLALAGEQKDTLTIFM